jgi:aldehyde:ferredoxin oxidoreductase
MMKYAGYDHLIITGRSERPSYIRIDDDEVEILDAGHLWGKDTWETTDAIRRDYPNHFVDCIGPAAERGIRYSIVLCGKRSSYNKMGPGAVMGSKKLKAIAAHGTKGVRVADPAKFRELTDAITSDILSDNELNIYRSIGEPTTDRRGFTSEEFRSRVAERPYACISCPVACKHTIHLRGGAYDGLRFRISHLDALAGHNRLAEPRSWDELAKLVEEENRVGVEASSTAGMLNYLIECAERNRITATELEFMPKRGISGAHEFISLMMDKRGIGEIASRGLLGAIEQIGRDTEVYSKHTKSIGIEHGFERQISNFDVGLLTSPRAKGELSHVPFGGGNTMDLGLVMFERFCEDLGLSSEAAERVCDGPEGFNVGRLVKWLEDYSSVYLALGFCDRSIIMRHMNLTKVSELYTAATGLDVGPSGLLVAGERVLNVLKLLNIRFGAARSDDLPSRGATWPPGRHILFRGFDYGSLDQILGEYYDERGWNAETGIPLKDTLAHLGLST